ncbi:MAG: hypothetical protein GF350_08305 [Chitinivibrionales bacterium]|nr:hypothetical protein [Chitinivibrionales bacterium]
MTAACSMKTTIFMPPSAQPDQTFPHLVTIAAQLDHIRSRTESTGRKTGTPAPGPCPMPWLRSTVIYTGDNVGPSVPARLQ